MRKYLPFIFILLMIFIILGSSTMDGQTSYGASKEISSYIIKVLRYFGDTNYTASTIETIIRKMAHFIEYMLLAVLFTIGFSNTLRNKCAAFLISAVIGTGISFVDEGLIQAISGRASSLFDIMIDTSGILTGLIIIFLNKGLSMRSDN